MKNCALCNRTLSKENNSKEHIIPNSIGGKRKVFGFICKACNNNYGSIWDAALAKIMAPLCIMLNVKREKGATPDQVFETIKGESIRVRGDGTMTRDKANAAIVEKNDKKYIQVNARTTNEAKLLLQGF